jgi:hypothetical protein
MSDMVKVLEDWKLTKSPMGKLITALLISCLAQSAMAADAVPDAATAIKIGAAALRANLGEKTYSELMQDMTWEAASDGDIWDAGPTLKPHQEARPCKDHPELNCVLVQTGGWIVRISRHDGHVISIIEER